MADKSLPPEGNDAPGRHLSFDDPMRRDRRAFLRRAAIAAPVVLATVHARSVWAQEPLSTLAAGCASIGPSGWRARNENLVETQCGSLDLAPAPTDTTTEPAP
jgi:hypothetical protein